MSRLHGVVMHWTVGGAVANGVDKQHYHFITQQDGSTVAGDHVPEDNLFIGDGDYAAHTRNANTGRIGMAMAGMVGALHRPFTPGTRPLTWGQVNAFCLFVAGLCDRYGIPVTRQTVLTHAEVQPTLGIAQNGKWDICWLPGMTQPGDPIEVGDRLRGDIIKNLKG